MKLSLLILLGILSACLGYTTLYRHSSVSVYDKNTLVYMNLFDFSHYETIYLEMTVYGGYFTQTYFYYKLTRFSGDDNPTSPNFKYDQDNSGKTYYFTLENNYYNYLYFYPPSFSGTSVFIKNTYGLSLAVGAIVGIVIACIIVIAAVTIIVICCRRRRYSSYVAHTTPVVYGPPVVPAYPPPTYY